MKILQIIKQIIYSIFILLFLIVKPPPSIPPAGMMESAWFG